MLLVLAPVPGNGPDTFTALVQSTLARDVVGLQMAGVRVAAWPQAIVDAATAEAALDRSNAWAVVWSEVLGNERLVHIDYHQGPGMTAPIPVPPQAIALPVQPSRAADARTVARLLLASVLAARGDPDTARALLVQAQAAPPSDPTAQAALEAARTDLAKAAPPAPTAASRP